MGQLGRRKNDPDERNKKFWLFYYREEEIEGIN
jgi:hypothetical protein